MTRHSKFILTAGCAIMLSGCGVSITSSLPSHGSGAISGSVSFTGSIAKTLENNIIMLANVKSDIIKNNGTDVVSSINNSANPSVVFSYKVPYPITTKTSTILGISNYNIVLGKTTWHESITLVDASLLKSAIDNSSGTSSYSSSVKATMLSLTNIQIIANTPGPVTYAPSPWRFSNNTATYSSSLNNFKQGVVTISGVYQKNFFTTYWIYITAVLLGGVSLATVYYQKKRS